MFCLYRMMASGFAVSAAAQLTTGMNGPAYFVCARGPFDCFLLKNHSNAWRESVKVNIAIAKEVLGKRCFEPHEGWFVSQVDTDRSVGVATADLSFLEVSTFLHKQRDYLSLCCRFHHND